MATTSGNQSRFAAPGQQNPWVDEATSTFVLDAGGAPAPLLVGATSFGEMQNPAWQGPNWRGSGPILFGGEQLQRVAGFGCQPDRAGNDFNGDHHRRDERCHRRPIVGKCPLDGTIVADMAAADVNGTATYSGLLKVLTDLDATLASSGTKLTSAELSDLKTIAANLNNGMATSSYLTYAVNALVDGNAADAIWTGGSASSTTLGNLAVGSSATQLSDLIGKMVLGNYLPSSQVNMSGYAPFSVSYSASSNPYGSSGPSMNDINQGYLGDCFFLSSLAEVADKILSLITSMFCANGNNTYGVRFYVDGTAEYITVNTQLADGGTIFNYATDIWASLAEKAYAQLQAGGAVTGNTISGDFLVGDRQRRLPGICSGGDHRRLRDHQFQRQRQHMVDRSLSSFGLTKYSNGSSTATVLWRASGRPRRRR